MSGAVLIRSAYRLLGNALTPALRLWLEQRARRGKEDPFRMGERFGLPSLARPPGTLVWLHAASVGETQSVLTLVRALLQQNPELNLLITTGTVTSAALVAQQNLPRVTHQFIPVDTPASVHRFLQHWQPSLALWVESEFWPQLLWQTRARGVPMLLINARISEKTYRGWKRWKRTIATLLSCFETIYAGSAEDAVRIRNLGARDVREVGNLKYDAAPLPVDSKLSQELAKRTEGRLMFVAASTHAPEERYVAAAHQHVAQQFPSLLTVIVPRHPKRGNEIASDLRARGFALAQRSKSEPITPQTTIYLADTMGELGSLYNLADLVFMGGSLIPHGGQNPLEAARFGKPIITGSYIHNFEAIIAQFAAQHAICMVANPEELSRHVGILLEDGKARQQLAQQASAVVSAARGASQIILQHCDQLLRANKPRAAA